MTAILGLNDRLVSFSFIILGVGGGSNNNGAMFIAGVAALVAGSLAMACGNYNKKLYIIFKNNFFFF